MADQLGPIDDEQIQPNGVDLRLDTILEQNTSGRIGIGEKTIGEREPVATVEESIANSSDTDDVDGDTYVLDPGGYVAQYVETVSIPDGHIGFVLPRSSLMRNSCMLNTAVWDAGYTGRGEGLLQVHHTIEIERGARIAQLILAQADHEGLYDGSYQGERVD